MSVPVASQKNLLFNSDAHTERVVMTGHLTFTTTNSPQTIAHNLGYIPLVKAWAESPSGHVNIATQDPFCTMETAISIDTINVTITVYPNQSPFTMVTTNVYYRIYAEGL